MHPKHIYEELYKSHPQLAPTAGKLFDGLYAKSLHMRCTVMQSASQPWMARTVIDLLDLKTFIGVANDTNSLPLVLTRVQFEMLTDDQKNTVSFFGPAVFVDGPKWEGVFVTAQDLQAALMAYLCEWFDRPFNPWTSASLEKYGAQASYQMIELNRALYYPTANPLVLSRLCLALGLFIGTLSEKIKEVRDCASEQMSAGRREYALRSLGEHFNSLVMQARRKQEQTLVASLIS